MLLTLYQVADRLNLTYSQVLRLVHSPQKKIKAINIGSEARKSWRVSEAALNAFLGRADNFDAPDVFVPKPSKFFG